jgi:glycosyltransferase involved in cell wall biosynthesis
MSSPKVSVLIPTYNYAHYLDETIQSVMDQTFTDFELVIVDNCSTDNTRAVVEKYLDDKRVSFYINERNIGLVGNWNKCLDYAKGEYIKFLCADDKFHPELLQQFVAVMEQYPNVSLISSYNEMFGLRNDFRKPPHTGLVSGAAAWAEIIEAGGCNWLFAPSAVMFRKEGLKVGRFDPHLIKLTDLEFYLRLLTTGDCYIIPERLSYIRAHAETQTAKNLRKKPVLVFERYRFMTNIKNISPPITSQTQAAIDAHIKQRAVRCALLMYEMVPRLYKRESRTIFKKAFQIARAHGVLLAPFTHHLLWDHIGKRLKGQ